MLEMWFSSFLGCESQAAFRKQPLPSASLIYGQIFLLGGGCRLPVLCALYRYTVFVAVGPVEGYIDLPPNTRSESVTVQVIAVSISWPLHPAEKCWKVCVKTCTCDYLSIIWFPIGSMYGIYANIGGILMVNVTIAYMAPMGFIITDMHHSKLGAKCSEISEPNPEDPQFFSLSCPRNPMAHPVMPCCAPLGIIRNLTGKSSTRHCWNPWSTLWSSGTTWTSPMIRAATTPLRRPGTAGIRSGWELQMAWLL